jgi:hypothetical protein
MKKSNIVLVSAICLSTCWILLVGWFGASAINNYLEGNEPVFARTHEQYLDSHKVCFPTPLTELVLSAEGTAAVTILPGKELAVLLNPKLWSCVFADLGNGKARISLVKRLDHYEPVTITIPGIPSLSLDNFSDVTVKGLDLGEIHLQCIQVGSFSLSGCRAGKISLDFPRSRDYQEIYIEKSNRFDTLLVSARGTGRIRLEAVGTSNLFSISDSIHLEAPYDLMKKLVKTGDRVF